MKQNILIVCILLMISSCGRSHEDVNDIAQYDKYNKEKQMMAQKYYELMQSPEKNKTKLQKLDQKIHDINKNLKHLSMKEHVRDYLRTKYLKENFDENGKDKLSRRTGNSETLNSDKFDYYVDNDSIDAEYDFSNKEFVETTKDNSTNDMDIDDEPVSNSNEYIEPDEGFYAKDVSNTRPDDVNNDNMESTEGDNIDAEYEFEDENNE